MSETATPPSSTAALTSRLQIACALLACALLSNCRKVDDRAQVQEQPVAQDPDLQTPDQVRAHRRGLENAKAMMENAKLCEPATGTADQSACQRACELNHSNSCANWGQFYETSDPERALTLYQRACRGGSGIGCEAHAERARAAGSIDQAALYLSARRYHRVHCTQGYARSCSQLAHLFEAGLGGSADRDIGRSYRMRACRLGISSDC